jgi:glycine hydroxymethyltransferase
MPPPRFKPSFHSWHEKTPFLTSGLRIGTPAITTRGLTEEHMAVIVDMIDEVISDIENEALIAGIGEKVIKKRHN